MGGEGEGQLSALGGKSHILPEVLAADWSVTIKAREAVDPLIQQQVKGQET